MNLALMAHLMILLTYDGITRRLNAAIQCIQLVIE